MARGPQLEPQLGVGCRGGPRRAARAVGQRRSFQGLVDAPPGGTPGERTRYECITGGSSLVAKTQI